MIIENLCMILQLWNVCSPGLYATVSHHLPSLLATGLLVFSTCPTYAIGLTTIVVKKCTGGRAIWYVYFSYVDGTIQIIVILGMALFMAVSILFWWALNMNGEWGQLSMIF